MKPYIPNLKEEYIVINPKESDFNSNSLIPMIRTGNYIVNVPDS